MQSPLQNNIRIMWIMDALSIQGYFQMCSGVTLMY